MRFNIIMNYATIDRIGEVLESRFLSRPRDFPIIAGPIGRGNGAYLTPAWDCSCLLLVRLHPRAALLLPADGLAASR